MRRQHKVAAEILLIALKQEEKALEEYRKIEEWLVLQKATSREELYDRFHFHKKEAAVPFSEEDLLPYVKRFDSLPREDFTLPVSLYLDNLRSAANVGNILRTAESFGIKTICFSPQTPFIDHPKVIMVAKGVLPCLTCHHDKSLLARPFIALETTENATPLESFTFDKPCTLILGNEEYGISRSMLEEAEHVVYIPLFGIKNSLNVSAAFAIAAREIAKNTRKI